MQAGCEMLMNVVDELRKRSIQTCVRFVKLAMVQLIKANADKCSRLKEPIQAEEKQIIHQDAERLFRFLDASAPNSEVDERTIANEIITARFG
jgi:hypothetical protein